MVRNLPANAEATGSVPGLERYPGRRKGNPLQYSCWDDPMDRGAWQAIVYGGLCRESDMTDCIRMHVQQHASAMCACVLNHFSCV